MPDKKQSFLKGAMILTIATMIVKVIGMFYKIPLGNILGATGMSYFMTAYNIFNPIYALSVAGFPVAVSKMVAESAARGNYREVKRVFRSSFLLFVVTGLAGFAVMFWGAGGFAGLVDNPQASLSIMALAPSIFFCCVMSAYRGYYQGLGNMTPTAVSQIVESVVKLVCGIFFAVATLRYAMDSYAGTGLVFGIRADSKAHAELLALPWAAAAAILGVTVSAAAGALYLFLRRMIRGDGIGNQPAVSSRYVMSGGEIIKKLAKYALPICAGSALTQVTGLIDVATIMNRVNVAMLRGGEIVLNMHAGNLPPELAPEEVPRYLYGAYSYCSSLFNLVPALTIPLGISVLPLISSHWALRDKEAAARKARSVIKLAALVSVPAGLGLFALSGPILALLFPERMSEAAIAAPVLRSLGLAAVFLGITAPISSIFQAVGRADIPVKLMAVGAVLKTAVNYVMLAMPRYNINAAPYGTIACYVFIFAASVVLLRKTIGVGFDPVSTFLKPLACGIICAAAARTSFDLLERLMQSRLNCLISIAIGGSIYMIFVLFLRIITKNEVLMLPAGKKVAKILEKHLYLG